MDSRALLEVKNQLNGPLWRYVKSQLATKELSLLREAADYVPKTLEETNMRDRTLATASIYNQLLDEIPAWIEADYTQAQENEAKK